MTLKLKKPPIENPIPLDKKLTKGIPKEAVKLLTTATAASRYDRFDDPVPELEQIELDKKNEERDKAYKRLEHQDSEIIRIGEGLEESKKAKVKLTKAEKKSAFDRYLDIFYYRPNTKNFDLDAPEAETPRALPELDALEAKMPKYFPAPEPATFFTKERLRCQKPNYVIDPEAYIPNSVLAKILFPPPPPGTEEVKWRPPGLTDEQLAQIAAHNSKVHLIIF